MLWAAQSTARTSCVCPCLADCRQGGDTREDGMVTPGSGCHQLYLSQILGHPHCEVWALVLLCFRSLRASGAGLPLCFPYLCAVSRGSGRVLFWSTQRPVLPAEIGVGASSGSRPVCSVGREQLGMWRGPGTTSASVVGQTLL